MIAERPWIAGPRSTRRTIASCTERSPTASRPFAPMFTFAGSTLLYGYVINIKSRLPQASPFCSRFCFTLLLQTVSNVLRPICPRMVSPPAPPRAPPVHAVYPFISRPIAPPSCVLFCRLPPESGVFAHVRPHVSVWRCCCSSSGSGVRRGTGTRCPATLTKNRSILRAGEQHGNRNDKAER